MTETLFILALFVAAVAVAWIIGRRDGYAAAGHAHVDNDRLLARAIAALSIVIWAIDEGEVVRLSMGGALKALGLESGELVGVHLSEIMQNSEQGTDAVRACFDDGMSRRRTTRHSAADGSTRWLKQEFVPLRNVTTGTIELVAGIAHDVTDEETRARYTETEALQVSARRLAGIDVR